MVRGVMVALTPLTYVTTIFKENNCNIISSRSIYPTPQTALVIANLYVIKVVC